ncbi:phosphoribosylglycinamide formyltransferase [Niabella ginsenosidivorans]|uniref:phosphoribosylglycinamide formyltransferase 1 n=1 Tax=Niabella ginsenosidivorans TaxID=1176587 RepID=A0A1A9IBM2_9BACT|nr:phosphoribosylglycinamide formyltransferase [Niabella ginsenosidivorans]ANH84170.1 phosphoribosylglycinamide formyltransferase [Niabella ginsenosidivorans]
MKKKKIVLFASGAGSNARQLIHYFKDHASVTVSLIVCNKPGAGVTKIAEREGIELMLIDKHRLQSPDFAKILLEKGTDFIILAGFLLKIPATLIEAFPRHIINIHPALLPKYGGKGMYGHYVHEAVINAREKESGITIHYVDEQYDHGATIFQTTCPVSASDTPESLARKVQFLEHQHFAPVVERLVLKEVS